MKNEIWKAVKGYPNYEVSNKGRVKRLKTKKFKNERVLTQSTNTTGRKFVHFTNGDKQDKHLVHRLVAEAFLGKCPEGMIVAHCDGNHLNNDLENLRFDNKSENAIDMYRHGGLSGSGKLETTDVLEIRKLYKTNKYTQKEIAIMFGVSRGNVSSIINGRSFSWLNDDGTINDTIA